MKYADSEGNEYPANKVRHVVVDTPAAQFRGYVTKASYEKTNCIDDWVEVSPRKEQTNDR